MAQHRPANVPVKDSALADRRDPFEPDDDLVDELAPGTKLLKGQYTIVRYINSGGFGITYLAKDSLDRDVVIKECFPSAFCRRSKAVVAARSRAHSAELRSIVQLFVREARSLAKIVHPNIVAVHQVFEDNGTAYMAIDYINGLDLQQIIEGQGRMPAADELVLLTEKLLAAVGFIHANDMLHRDISPDNILLDTTGEPILIDFGAAREQASQTNRAMSALRVVKDGYSPQEFYVAGSAQGPWSDLYALGATLYHMISGEAPVNGQARLAALAEAKTDPYVPLDGRFDGYPTGFLAAIDKAMQTLPKNRVQTAQDWLWMFRPGISLPLTPGDDIAASVHAMVVNSRIDGLSVVQAGALAGAPGGTAERAAPAPKPTGPAFGAPPQFARQVSKQPPLTDWLENSSVVTEDNSKPEAPVPPAPPAKRGFGIVQLVVGGMVALAMVGIVLTQLGGETPAIEDQAGPKPTAETASLIPQPATEAVDATDGGSAEAADVVAVVLPPLGATDGAAAAETAAATDEAAPLTPAEPAPAAEAVTGDAANDVATAPESPAPEAIAPQADVAAPAIDPANLLANQIAFAAWDVAMPFMDESRIIGGERLAIVSRILPTTDLAEAGDWLAPGLLLYTVNGVDIQNSGNVTTAVLNAMQVDPDGRSRVVVEYAGSSLERQSGLLTVEAKRIVNLENGVRVSFHVVDAVWQGEVTAVVNPAVTQLRQGDILFREKSTGIALSAPDALETVMAELVKAGITSTEFSIIRDNKVETVTMQLALKSGR